MKRFASFVKNYFFKKKKKSVAKPATMIDVPDSGSDAGSSDGKDTFKGLSNSSIYLGEGAVLYL